MLARDTTGTIGFPMRRADKIYAMAMVTFALAACTSSRSKETEQSDAGATLVPSATPVPSPTQSAVPAPPLVLACPDDMVKVGERLCVDRYESQLVDVASSRPLSPHYPVLDDYDTFLEARRSEAAAFLARRTGTAVDVPFPELPAWQRRGRPMPKAVSKSGVVPNAYLTRAVAAGACELAGKRLCSLVEWQTACRGERATKHPYGEQFTNFRCNVFREAHPGHVLFGDASVGMQDPRMGLVEGSRGPLLTPTGGTPTCASHWGDGVIYDMVGNLDEWVDDAAGTFAGGFFSRATRDGCERIVVAHGPDYRDYTTGARCCRDARP